MTISHALGGLTRHKHFLRGKSNITECHPSSGPLLFPILFISYVGMLTMYFPSILCYWESNLSPVRTPWEHPSHVPTESKRELSVADMKSRCVKLCGTRHIRAHVWNETRCPLMKQDWCHGCGFLVLLLAFLKCELRWDFYLLFTDHLAFLWKILLDGLDSRIFHQGSRKAKRLEKLSKNKTKEKTSGL